MKKWKQILALSALLCVYTQVVFGQFKSDSLTASLQQVITKDSLPGMSVVLVDAKHMIYQHNFGYADVANKTGYSTQTVQIIGSISKTFIAIALMKAVEMGYFKLDDDINTILPFKVTNPNYPTGTITVRQLSDHTSGIIDNPATFPDTYIFKEHFAAYDTTAYKMLQGLGYTQKVTDTALNTYLPAYLTAGGKYYSAKNFGEGAPGSSSSYSNVASALAAYLIEVKSGMSYANFVEKYVFKPLKMNNSGWFLDAAKRDKYAKHYLDLTRAFPFYQTITYPDGGIRTCTADLSKYLMALIKGYNGDESLLSKQSYQAMFTPQFSKENPPKGISLANRNKGVFWNLYNNGTIGHDGDDPGIITYLFFNPKTGLGGVFLCNKYLTDKSPIIKLLVDATDGK